MSVNVFEIAASFFGVSVDEVKLNYEKIPDIDAYYFWQKQRGSCSLIVGINGEKLGATSAVSFEKHLEAFVNGKRN